MTFLIQRIGSLARKTYERQAKNSAVDLSISSKKDAEELEKMLNLLTIQDLKIDPKLLIDREPFNPSLHRGAPVTYMQLFQNEDVNICIFFLKNGVKLPLHDHPDMRGLLKVIYGTVSIQSYSMTKKVYSSRNILRQIEDSLQKPSYCVHEAVKHKSVEVSYKDPACKLQPAENNLHEISTVNGPAAFLDILSPPYGYDTVTSTERECHYFKEFNFPMTRESPDPKSVWLYDIDTPKEFWCDQSEYRGPTLVE